MNENKKQELIRRLQAAKEEREREYVHSRDCKCGGHGNLPMSQFSCGYVPCVA